jgi:hypothetical protein
VLKSPRWRQVGLGPVCARRLGLRLVAPRPTLVPAGPARHVEPDEDQLELFDLTEGAVDADPA